VVDKDHQCVGVLSTTDFLSLTKDGHACHPSVCTDWGVVELEQLPEDEIRQYMTADPVTVPPSMGICRLARQMVDAHIHRVIVVDRESRPIGIVTSTDLLAALAQAESFQ